MKKILFIFVLPFLFNVSSFADSNTFSKQFCKIRKKQQCGCISKYHKNLTMLLFESLDFISYQKDTIYMLESYDLETATFYFSVWNKKNKKEFYSQGIELLESENFFVERLYSMIENWDVVGIRQAEKQMSEPMLGGSVITGIRIVTTGKKIQVKCIHFKEFFDVGKDVEMH